MRNNQMVLEGDGQPNAPNPRESNPPCYDDAILMPRLKNSITSLKLSSLSSEKRASKRTRSEEQLSAIALDPSQRPILTARSRKNLFHQWAAKAGDSSTALINESKIDIDSSRKSFEIIAQLETEDGHSPYAKRRPIIGDEDHSNQDHEPLEQINTISESLNIQEVACGGQDEPIYQNFNRSESIYQNEMPHTSQTFFAPNIPPYPISSSSSISSFSSYNTSVDSDDYVRLPQRTRSYSFRHSDV